MASDFIELDRRFAEYQPDDSPETLAQRSYLMELTGRVNGESWPEILKHRLVIVLGEPGCGKTEELKAQHLKQSSSSFFLELNRLVTEEVPSILDDDDNRRLTMWKNDRGDATFFLDAVDESKIKRADDFFTALDRVKKTIGPAIQRARFIISSRIREWRPETDLAGVLQRLGIDPATIKVGEPGSGRTPLSPISRNSSVMKDEEESEDIEAHVVTLLPLTPSQVEKYSREKGIKSPQSFLEALEENNAWAFAGRPLDVDLLHAYWNDKGHLSNLTALSEYMITKLLEEVPNRSSQDILTQDRAQEGAEYLAAASVLCRKLKFCIPDAFEASKENMLSPADILPETWLPKDRQALLDRALFDAASHGAMSFHHRYHSDYLAAAWIARLMNTTGTLGVLEDLLFAIVNGQRVMRPSLKTAAAWLITKGSEPWRRTLAGWILEACPEIHLTYGDPAAMPLEYRRQVLNKLIDRFRGRKNVMLDLDHTALARFADTGLADEINSYLEDKTISEDLRADLLMVVRAGKMSACIPTTLSIFSDSSASDNLRTYAVTVIRDAGDNDHRCQLANLWKGLPKISNVLVARLCEALYPHVIDSEGLLELIGRSENIPPSIGIDLPYYLGELLKEHLSTAHSQVLIEGILALLSTPPLSDKHNLSIKFYWVTCLIPICLQRLLREQDLSVELQDKVISACFVLEKVKRHGDPQDSFRSTTAEDEPSIQQLLSMHSEIRRKMFWKRVAKYRIKHGREPLKQQLTGYGTVFPINTEDLDWLLSDANSDLPLADRRLAIEAAVNQLWSSHQNLWPSAWKLLSHTRGDPELKEICHQYVWDRLRAPFMIFWSKYFRYKLLDKHWRHTKIHGVQLRYRNVRDRLWLWRHLGELRKGNYPDTLAYFARGAGSSSGSQLGGSNWDKIAKKWGKRISSAAKIGCETSWRQFSPPFPFEKQARNSIDNRLFVGLSGLQTLWHEGHLNFSALPSADVDLLVHYACNELNGFPEWFPSLLEAREEETAIALRMAIDGEWNYPEHMEHVHDVTARLAWMPNAAEVLSQIVTERLMASDPENHRILEYALAAIVRASKSTPSALLSIARKRIMLYTTEQPQWFNWMNIWLQLDAMQALDYLDSILSSLGEKGDELMVRLCAAMHGRLGEQRQISNPSYLKPKSLARFIPLSYRYVNLDQDIHRGGQGAYSPGLRDHAQDFRNGLLRSLGNDKDPETEETLRTLLTVPELHSSQDWILHLLDELKYILVDDVPWEAGDIRVFAKEYCSEPRSDYQLFRLVVRLLMDIKDTVERSENASNRLWVRAGDQEEKLRGGLHKKLSERSLDWFTVVPEKEVDLKQQPDLSIERTGLNSLPIEIKLSERWSIRELLKGLEDQLVGQYLRSANIRHGIYVLGNTVPKRRWKMPDSNLRINFQELVSMLQQQAKELQFELRTQLDDIEVIGIDFSDPRDR